MIVVPQWVMWFYVKVEVHLVTSRDCEHWNIETIYSGQTLIPRGGDGAWDKGHVLPAAQMVTAHGKHWLYYMGMNER